MDSFETIIIGAGVIGLTIARELAQAGQDVLILERNTAWGQETSARNSEVMHAGLYYPPGSLRAELCLEGYERLAAYLKARDLPWRRCGKLIVAANDTELSALAAIRRNAAAAGAPLLEELTGAQARAMEPALACEGALWSPRTGIFDSHVFMQSLLAEAEAAGATLALQSPVEHLELGQGGYVVTLAAAPGEAPYQIKAARLINAAGHRAVDLARSMQGMPQQGLPQIRFARGTWYGVTGRPAFSRLIYPVPEPGGLGIHLTLDLQGSMRFGPDVEWIAAPDYQLSDHRRADFARAVARYWPGLPAADLHPVACGVRPKLTGPGEPAADFMIHGPAAHGLPGLVHLFGIESPGLTSSLAIADRVRQALA